LRKRPYDAALLGDGDEDARRDEAQIAVGPARQRLETDRLARPDIDDRLEIRLDLAV